MIKYMELPRLHLKVDSETELRILGEDDAPELFHLIESNRAYLRMWLPWLDFTTTIGEEINFIRTTQEQYTHNKSFTCSILYKGQIAGTIGYHSIDWSNRKVEIGYLLGSSFQGKGLMTGACRAMTTYAFNELDLNKVEIRCATENKRSRAIPERLGFKQEGIIRQSEWLYDHYVDLVLYGMLVGEWEYM